MITVSMNFHERISTADNRHQWNKFDLMETGEIDGMSRKSNMHGDLLFLTNLETNLQMRQIVK